MDAVTKARVAAFEQRAMRDGPLTLEQRIERARLLALAAAPAVEEPTLDMATSADVDVQLITVTRNELHDLVYAAASNYVYRLSSMGREKGRLHASRIADEALGILAGHPDYTHMGADPRAAQEVARRH